MPAAKAISKRSASWRKPAGGSSYCKPRRKLKTRWLSQRAATRHRRRAGKQQLESSLANEGGALKLLQQTSRS